MCGSLSEEFVQNWALKVGSHADMAIARSVGKKVVQASLKSPMNASAGVHQLLHTPEQCWQHEVTMRCT